MNNDNYQIEDLENDAQKKSNTAKRAVAGLGLAAVGGGAAFAATELIDSHNDSASDTKPEITADELTISLSGGVSEQEMPEPQPEPQPQPQPQEVHVHHHYEQPKPETPDVDFNGSTVVHDAEGNVVAQIDEGTIDGTRFALYDIDGDGVADGMAYDANRNGVFDEDELMDVRNEFIAMSNPVDAVHVFSEDIAQIDPIVPVDPNEEDDLRDIQNDFKYEKTGERYGNDVAENNPDYNGRHNINQYAGYESGERELPDDTTVPEIYAEEENLPGSNPESLANPGIIEEDMLTSYEEDTEEYIITSEDNMGEVYIAEEVSTDGGYNDDLAYGDTEASSENTDTDLNLVDEEPTTDIAEATEDTQSDDFSEYA